MPEADDIQLLREFAERQSDAAFAALVTRHVNLVYSVALRQTGNPHAAEEITQAVFIILASKAGSLGAKTILSGWLYQTARLTAANYRRTEFRRARREQEAHMQSVLNEPEPDVWPQIAPLLDDALGKLGEKDRHAIVLRFFENKSLGEVGAALGASEDAAKMRVTRALEKLRRIFSKRGVALTAALIAGAVSANSVQAAPVGLVVAVTAAAAKGAAVSVSTLTLIKGALKIMAWTKAKTAIAVTAVILATGTTTVVVTNAVTGSSGTQTQRLADGSVLVLNQVSFGGTKEFIHGNGLETVLKNAIPAKGVQLGRFKLTRPTLQTFEAPPGKSQLVAEFKVIGGNVANHPLVKPAFYREFRCVIRGESGVEYVTEFWGGKFLTYSDGYYGYIIASRFPRDSRWLWLLIERRESSDQGGPWKSMAEFKIENTVRSAIRPWVADPIHVAKTVGGMDFILDEITVVTQSYSPRDIWNHIVTTPFQVRSNDLILTNWGAAYVRVEDASGNWDYNLASHRGLDPRYVWKLEVDFEPASDFSTASSVTVRVPVALAAPIVTNVAGTTVTISWVNQDMLNVKIPTNRLDLAVRFISAQDESGKNIDGSTGSWGQYGFWRRIELPSKSEEVQATIAVVPNLHVSFFAQPRLIVGGSKN